MGVMACDREGCENIMCDHFSYEYGYLCSSCMDELKNTPVSAISIEEFMRSPKKNRDILYGDYVLDVFSDNC